MIKLTATAITVDAAAPDGSRAGQRVIMGIAAPYGVTASVSSGESVLFEPGSLTASDRMPRVYMFHDSSQPVGIVTQLDNSSPNELLFSARISATPLGDTALTLSADGVLDVSVGITPQEWTTDDAGTMRITAATVDEISLVPQPAFTAAKITEVYASASIHHQPDEIDNNQENPLDEETPEMEKTPEVAAVEAATPTAPIWAEAPKRFTMPSAAQYMAAYASSPSEFAQINAQIKAAAPFIDTTSTPGILPEIITQSVYDGLNPIRPFVSAIGTRAMPTAGATFRLAKITVRPVATEQAGENQTLDPSTVTVSNTDVSKLTFGTYVTVSEQSLDFTDPASLNIILEQLAIAYGQSTNAYAVDNCYNAITQTATVTDVTVGADWVSAIYEGAKQISETSNYLPSHLFLPPSSWKAVATSVDDQNRPLFPFVGAPNLSGVNAGGSFSANSWNGNPLGLTVVVDKDAPGSFMGHAAGPAAGYQFFEQMKGAISVDVPSSLSRTIAFRGYAAGSMRDATKFVKFI
jgi:phage head maturation protease